MGEDGAAQKVFRHVLASMPNASITLPWSFRRGERLIVPETFGDSPWSSDTWRFLPSFNRAQTPPRVLILDGKPFLRCLQGHGLDLWNRRWHWRCSASYSPSVPMMTRTREQWRCRWCSACLDGGQAFALTMRYPDDPCCETLYGRTAGVFGACTQQAGRGGPERGP